MKKLISLFTVLALLFSSCSALAMEVQLLAAPEQEGAEAPSLDNIKVGDSITVDGYAVISPTSFGSQDNLGYYGQGSSKVKYDNWYRSGQDAEFMILRMDLTNLSTRDRNFLENVDVRVIYDDLYEYAGWAWQLNYNNETYGDAYTYGVYTKIQNTEFVIDRNDQFPVGPMYTGHYFFGCTLPNAIVNGKAPLRMIISLDGLELTFNIRK